MAKKGTRLREFEKNHRVLNISEEQEARKKRKETTKASKAVKEVKAVNEVADESPKSRRHLVKLIGSVVVIIFILMVVMSIKNIFDLREEESALKQRNEELLQLKEELNMELDNVNSKEYIEEQARKELKLVRGNELIFYFPDDWEKIVEDRKNQETQDTQDSKVEKDTTEESNE